MRNIQRESSVSEVCVGDWDIWCFEGFENSKNGPEYTCMQLCPDTLACNCSKHFTTTHDKTYH